MCQLLSYMRVCQLKKSYLCNLRRKTLYVLRGAPRYFQEFMRDGLQRLGWKPMAGDPSLFALFDAQSALVGVLTIF